MWWERGPLSGLPAALQLSKLELWKRESSSHGHEGKARANSSLWPQHLNRCLEHSRCSINLCSRTRYVSSECIHGNFTRSGQPCTQLGRRHPYRERMAGKQGSRLLVSMNDQRLAVGKKTEAETQPSGNTGSDWAWEGGHRSCIHGTQPSAYPEMPSL